MHARCKRGGDHGRDLRGRNRSRNRSARSLARVGKLLEEKDARGAGQWTLRGRGGPRVGEGAAEQRSSGVTGARVEEAEKIELTRGAGPSAEASARCAGLGRVRGGDAWARLSARGVVRAG